MNFTNKKWDFDGNFTFKETPLIFENLEKIEIVGTLTLDFANIKNIDTSLICLIFEIKRKAQQGNQIIKFNNIPKSLINLATLYGVQNFLTH
jgi:ABC-type transporter Mla MlaB component